MARFNVVGLDDLQEQMLQRAKIAEEAVPEMLKAGGAVMQEAQRAEIRTMFRSRRSTGDLAASIVVSKIKERDSGKMVEVYPDGKDRQWPSLFVGNISKIDGTERDKRLRPAIRTKEYASAPVVHGGEYEGGGRCKR